MSEHFAIRGSHIGLGPQKHVSEPQCTPTILQCRAYNELDSSYSSGQLRVLAFAPTFDKFPLEENTYAAETGNVTLRCRPEGAPQPKFTWRKNANRIASGGKYTVFDNGNLLINRLDR